MKTLKVLAFIFFSFQIINSVNANKAEEGLYFKTTIAGDFQEITNRVKEELKKQGFSVITEIDMDEKLNEKLGTTVKPYKILGACNPGYAYKTLQIDDNIGVFLPCKVIIKQLDGGMIEVVSINPSKMMQIMNNEELTTVAEEVSQKLKKVIEAL